MEDYVWSSFIKICCEDFFHSSFKMSENCENRKEIKEKRKIVFENTGEDIKEIILGIFAQ